MFNLLRKFGAHKLEEEVRYAFTPDIRRLQEMALVRLFVYDGMMSGYREHEKIKDHCASLCKAFTLDTFNMFTKNLGEVTYPFALPSEHGYRVMGEVVAIDPMHLVVLDNLKMNGVQFIRQRVRVVVPYHRVFNRSQQTLKTEFDISDGRHVYVPGAFVTKAFMYIAVPEFWAAMLKGGLQITIRRGSGEFTYHIIDQNRISKTRLFTNKRVGKFYFFSPEEYKNF